MKENKIIEKSKAFKNLKKIFFPSESEEIITALSILKGTDFKNSLNIIGEELDKQVSKKFLKSKHNTEKNNYRSPYTNIFWPENLRSYLSPEVQQLETNLNTFLEDYAKVYYAGATSSGFVSEKMNNGYVFNIGIYKSNREKNEMMDYYYSYKMFSTITINLSNIQRNSGFRIDCNSSLVYDLEIDIKNIEEKISTNGVLEKYSKKNFMKDNKKPSSDEMIKLIGFFFEQTDCGLRNHELKNVLGIFEAQTEQLFKPRNLFQEELGRFFKDLKGVCSVVGKEDVVVYPQRTL